MANARTFICILMVLATTLVASAQELKACAGRSTCSSIARPVDVPDDVSLLQARSDVVKRAASSQDGGESQSNKHVRGDSEIVDENAQAEHEQMVDDSGKVDDTEQAFPGMIPPARIRHFMFARHGQSTGNNAASSLGFSRDTLRTTDGVLTDTGENQAVQRIQHMERWQSNGGDHLLRQLQEAQVLLVSPLRRALATLLIMVAEAMKRCELFPGQPQELAPQGQDGLCHGAVPRVIVDVRLTEKRATVSEDIGCGTDGPGHGDPIEYMAAVAHRYTGGLPNAGAGAGVDLQNAYMDILHNVQQAYVAEKQRATGMGPPYAHDGANCPRWHPKPTDAVTYANMIRDFKNDLATFPQNKYFIVGHSGWARYAFAPWLVNHDDAGNPFPTDAMQEQNLKNGGRQRISTLNNAGVLTGEVEEFAPATTLIGGVVPGDVPVIGSFTHVIARPIEPGDQSFPNTQPAKREFGMFNQIGEPERTLMIPAGSCFVYGIFDCQLNGAGGWAPRIFILSWLPPGRVTLSWSKTNPNGFTDKFLAEKPEGDMEVLHGASGGAPAVANGDDTITIHGANVNTGPIVLTLRIAMTNGAGEEVHPEDLAHDVKLQLLTDWMTKVLHYTDLEYIHAHGGKPC